MATKKSQITKTISLKQTDSPIIKEFIEKQTNFSESIRYLILAYCKENGVQDVTHKLTELIFMNTKYELNSNNVIKKETSVTQEIDINLKENKEEQEHNKVNDNLDNNLSAVEEEIEESVIPSCYD